MSENHDSSHQGQNVDRLLEPHRVLLARSTVSPEMMKQRGYWSAESRKELQELGFLPRQGNVPALITPIHCVEAQVGTHLMRPDKPRTNKEGVKAKYELPKGRPLRIDVPPACRAAVADPSKELWIADGPIQADAMASAGLTCIDVLGAFWTLKRLSIPSVSQGRMGSSRSLWVDVLTWWPWTSRVNSFSRKQSSL